MIEERNPSTLPSTMEPVSLPILVIDDEPAVLSCIQAALERSGYKVVCGESGVATLPLLESREFRGVICDLRMPGGMDGDDVYAWISQHRPELVNRFVLQTGDIASQDAADRLRRIGAPCIEKPFRIQEFLAVIEKTIGKAFQASCPCSYNSPELKRG
jgi:CheY-like chemotaxis protein